MVTTATQKAKTIKNDEYLTALGKWESCKPPYTSSHIRICVTAAKTVLLYINKSRRSKYEKDNYLRIEFSKSGKVSYYAEFPKNMSLKGRKLGEYPEMTLDVAREKALLVADGGLKSDSVHNFIKEYENTLQGKVDRKKLSENSFYTYMCRVNCVKSAFSDRDVFVILNTIN